MNLIFGEKICSLRFSQEVNEENWAFVMNHVVVRDISQIIEVKLLESNNLSGNTNFASFKVSRCV